MSSSNNKPVPVIYDTDMDLDCDDCGALAILHALADFQEATILGVICDVPVDSSVKIAHATNTYYNRGNLPIGYLKNEDFERGNRFKEYREHQQEVIASGRNYYPKKVVRFFNLDEIKIPNTWDAVPLYRHLLSKAEDFSVVIIAVGLLSALGDLLKSGHDEFSELSGMDLVRKKVKKLVTMGWGRFPEDNERLNWRMDWLAARTTLNLWPTELVVQTHGSEFLNGKMLSAKTTEENPVRKCYEFYLGPHHKGNFTWDLLTVYYAIRGCDEYFEEVSGYRLVLDKEPGKNYWVEDKEHYPPHKFLNLMSSRTKFKKEIEDLLIKPPGKKE
ncbi:MAG: hypothetical protein ACTSXH_18605 [Promethearchaeota archaeon]